LILVAIFDVCLLNNILEIYNENFPNDISSNKIYKFCIDKDYKILYLEKENKILGGLIFIQLNKEHIYIEYLFVDKKCQSNGVGKKLLNRFINDYKDYIISLHCEDFLIPYYEKFNFNKKDGKYYFKDKIFNLMVIDYNESKLKIINSDIIVELLNNSVWCK
jgi:ribosomal protein S18 acetylase RimI-like enzyme